MKDDREILTAGHGRSYEGFLSPLDVDDYVKSIRIINDNTLDISISALRESPNFSLAGFIIGLKRNQGVVLSRDYLIGMSLAHGFLVSSLPENIGLPTVNIFDIRKYNQLAEILESRKTFNSRNAYYFEDIYTALTKESSVARDMDEKEVRKAYLDFFSVLKELEVYDINEE